MASPAARIAARLVSRWSLTATASAPAAHSPLTTVTTSRARTRPESSSASPPPSPGTGASVIEASSRVISTPGPTAAADPASSANRRAWSTDPAPDPTSAASCSPEISGLQDAALVGSGAGSVDQARRLALLAGSAAAVGPGVEITLDDASITDAPVPGEGGGEADDDSGRVLARDVVTVVNGLWAAGAEAVAVNDHRLTSLAAIRAAGDAILVDFRALVPPYRITAIGDPQDLQIAFATSAAGTYLAGIEQNFGVQVSISGRSELEMPGDQGLRLRYARPPGPTGVAPNDAPTPPPTDQEVSP